MTTANHDETLAVVDEMPVLVDTDEPADAASDDPETEDQNSGGGVAGSLVSMLAFGAGYLVMKVVPPDVTFALIGGVAAGVIAGLVPFFVAKHRHQGSFAGWALGICAVSGAFLGILLAGPMALILTVASLVSGRGDEAEDTAEATEIAG